MEPIIAVENLVKRYGNFVAVDGISFYVFPGEIFGIVGPNGAGKTTTVEMTIGLRARDQGSVRVLGRDPQKERKAVAEQIGIQLQLAALPNRLKVWEAFDLYSTFYTKKVPWKPLLQEWGLADKRDALFETLSGGEKQRLFIALALLNDPEVVFLDELTTGLDPQARRQTWQLITQIRDRGKTVVLVTHFMEEAELLCDRVAIIDHGKIAAIDTPANLIASMAAERQVVFDYAPQVDLQLLHRMPAVTRIEHKNGTVRAFGEADNLVSSVVLALEQQQAPLRNFRTEQPNLEDVFINLTGHELRQ